MKRLTIAALIAAQLAAPVAAADLEATRIEGMRMGGFAGARLRISLDFGARERVQAGFALSPTMQVLRSDGSARHMIGEGIELGLSEGRAPGLSIAGRPIRHIVQGGDAPDGQRQNISTIGWVAIGVGVTLAAVFIVFELCRDGSICGTDDDG
ncbi:hypothetical protein [Allosphingosinicella sp.]|jgi:hypothetical protein|uniref:hypothetical protein n=1 Tax=Allosphingosinicella sp. TaxID=2823234 RepID=UPI002EFE32C5